MTPLLTRSEAASTASVHEPQVSNRPTLNTYYYAGEYQKFIDSTGGQIDNSRTLFYRGLVFLYLKDTKRAIAAFDRASELMPVYFFSQLGQAFKASINGSASDGIKILQELERENVAPDGELFYKVAQAYALLGDKQSALRILRYSIDHNFFCTPYMVQDPFLESLRREPEYSTLMGEAGLRYEYFKRKFF